jgi:hypothetical protein
MLKRRGESLLSLTLSHSHSRADLRDERKLYFPCGLELEHGSVFVFASVSYISIHVCHILMSLLCWTWADDGDYVLHTMYVVCTYYSGEGRAKPPIERVTRVTHVIGNPNPRILLITYVTVCSHVRCATRSSAYRLDCIPISFKGRNHVVHTNTK